MLMSKAEIIVERTPILKFSSKSDEGLVTYTPSRIYGHTHTHTQTETERQLGEETKRCGLRIKHSFLLLK
jgi:hypothetical protein